MDKMGALSKAVVLTVSRGLSFVPLAVIVHRLGRPPVGFVMIFVWFTGLTLDKDSGRAAGHRVMCAALRFSIRASPPSSES